MSNNILELFGVPTQLDNNPSEWATIIESQRCPYLERKCVTLQESTNQFRLSLASRASTDAAGIATCLGLQVSPNVELDIILNTLQSKISEKTLLTIN